MKIWHEFYGWNKDPFSIRPQTKLVGLNVEKEYMQHLIENGTLCMLAGPTGSGKSSLLMWFEEKLKNTDKTPIRINCLVISGANKIDLEIRKMRKFSDRLCFRQYPKKTVLLLDEAQNIDKDAAEFIKAQWDEGKIHSVVLASIDSTPKEFSGSLLDRLVGQTVTLPTLSYEEAIKLISLRTEGRPPFTPEAMEAIVKISANIPRRTLENCRAVCMAAASKETTLVDHNLVYEVLGAPRLPFVKTKSVPSETVRQSLPPVAEYVSPRETKSETTERDVSKTATSWELSKNLAANGLPPVSPEQVEIIKLLGRRDMTSEDVARTLNIPPGSARKQISRLIAQGAVTSIGQERPKTYGLTSEWKRAVVKE